MCQLFFDIMKKPIVMIGLINGKRLKLILYQVKSKNLRVGKKMAKSFNTLRGDNCL